MFNSACKIVTQNQIKANGTTPKIRDLLNISINVYKVIELWQQLGVIPCVACLKREFPDIQHVILDLMYSYSDLIEDFYKDHKYHLFGYFFYRNYRPKLLSKYALQNNWIVILVNLIYFDKKYALFMWKK